MINVINTSGGKDSTAMLLLAIEQGVENLHPVFCDTGNEHPMTYEYLRYLDDKIGIRIEWVKADFTKAIERKREKIKAAWLQEGITQERIDSVLQAMRPTGNPFLDLCMLKGRFPSSTLRFCTHELKIEVIKRHVYAPLLEQGNDIDSWQGIRRDESKSRARAMPREFAMKDKKTGAEVWNVRPILDWKAEDCFAMHKKHGIEPNPLYKLGMARVGCMPCINSRKSEVLEISRRFPDQIDRIERWEKIVAQCTKWDGATFFTSVAHDAAGIREVVRWAQTDRGGRQFGLFTDTEELPACSSQFGLCE